MSQSRQSTRATAPVGCREEDRAVDTHNTISTAAAAAAHTDREGRSHHTLLIVLVRGSCVSRDCPAMMLVLCCAELSGLSLLAGLNRCAHATCHRPVDSTPRQARLTTQPDMIRAWPPPVRL